MADGNTQLQWTDEQWNKVRQVVYEEARKARVAGNFLPLYGPLDPDATYVTRQALLKPNEQNEQGDSVAGFTVGDTSVLKLPTLQVKVYLKGAQVADPEMTSALIAFRRAASVLARLEDEIIFNGQKGPNEGPTHAGQRMALAKDEPWEVRGGDKTNGLLPPPPRPIRPEPGGALPSFTDLAKIGEALVSDVSKAVGDLEEKYHPGPFACVLDHVYFTAAQTPNPNSLVLPQDRILPFLGGGRQQRPLLLGRQATPSDQDKMAGSLRDQPVRSLRGESGEQSGRRLFK
jgi:hypothetical protein